MTILQEREQRGIEEGIERGVEQGRQEAKVEMVKDFISAGAEIELIVKASKLSREEVEKIKKEMLIDN